MRRAIRTRTVERVLRSHTARSRRRIDDKWTRLGFPPMRTPSPLTRLTGRELEVLGLVAEGLSNEAIARRLNVSIKTLEAICTSMFRSLELADSPHANRR